MINLKSISPYSETKSTQGFTTLRLRSGFTIVELLVVIVVIGILASITVVSYTGVSQKATAVALQSDLANAKKQVELYKVIHGSYPTELDPSDCPLSPVPDTTYCLKTSTNNDFTNYSSNGLVFTVTTTNPTNNISYAISNNTSPSVVEQAPSDWIAIGNQVWAKANLNVGTMITGVTNQANNSTPEKYCYNNLESNCDIYGGLYQWNEAMQYVTTPGARGLCPINSHIPTDDEWKELEMYLGMTLAQANDVLWRGTDQGTQIKIGGSTNLEVPLAGYRYFADGAFSLKDVSSSFWTSIESGISAYHRTFSLANETAYRHTNHKGDGFSVRCIAD